MMIKTLQILTILCITLISFQTSAQEDGSLEGQWNLTLSYNGEDVPSWLEISHSGLHTLVGRFVFLNGSARPISEVVVNDGQFRFSIPPQWEEGHNLVFNGKLEGDELKGTLLYTDGKTYSWVGTRAPKLAYNPKPKWGKPIKIFNGKNLDGWKALGENQWIVKNGVLTSEKSGSNLITTEKFNDFKLHIEFRIPEGSNSGVYLRGRYEVQIADNIGSDPSSILFGGVYGFLTPNEMVAKPAGEWQSFDITLIGRRVSIVANGKQIITDQNIPGMTGGALDNHEAEAGPFFIQGDHGAVEFRNIVVTPVLN